MADKVYALAQPRVEMVYPVHPQTEGANLGKVPAIVAEDWDGRKIFFTFERRDPISGEVLPTTFGEYIEEMKASAKSLTDAAQGLGIWLMLSGFTLSLEELINGMITGGYSRADALEYADRFEPGLDVVETIRCRLERVRREGQYFYRLTWRPSHSSG